MKGQVFVNKNTNEILNSKECTSGKAYKEIAIEPSFVKMYLNVFESIDKKPEMDLNLIVILSKYMSYANDDRTYNVIKLSTDIVDDICKKLNVSERTFRRRLSICIKNGLLFRTTKARQYVVNPWMMAKARWRVVCALRKDFRMFSTGEWIYTGNDKSIKNTYDFIVMEVDDE